MRRATYVVLLLAFLIAALFIAYRLRQPEPASKAGMASMAGIAAEADAWPR